MFYSIFRIQSFSTILQTKLTQLTFPLKQLLKYYCGHWHVQKLSASFPSYPSYSLSLPPSVNKAITVPFENTRAAITQSPILWVSDYQTFLSFSLHYFPLHILFSIHTKEVLPFLSHFSHHLLTERSQSHSCQKKKHSRL